MKFLNELERKQAIAAIKAAIKQLEAIRKSAEGWDTGIEIGDLRKTLRNLGCATHTASAEHSQSASGTHH
jgi:hypothetical protein